MKTLKQIIEEKEPESKIVKPRRISEEDVLDEFISEYLSFLSLNYSENNGFSEGYRHWRKALEKGFIEINEGKVSLVPVQPDYNTFGIQKKEENYLIHKGLIKYNGKNNLTNLEEFGVFGDPNEKIPTYLMTDSEAFTFPRFEASNEVYLCIDKRELLKRRTVFIDPNSIETSIYKDCILIDIGDIILGNSFFIMGGIPKEAIRSYFIPSTGGSNVINHRTK